MLTLQQRILADTPFIKRLRLRATIMLKSHSQGWLRRCATCVDTELCTQKGPALDLMFRFWRIEILKSFIYELVFYNLSAMEKGAGV